MHIKLRMREVVGAVIPAVLVVAASGCQSTGMTMPSLAFWKKNNDSFASANEPRPPSSEFRPGGSPSDGGTSGGYPYTADRRNDGLSPSNSDSSQYAPGGDTLSNPYRDAPYSGQSTAGSTGSRQPYGSSGSDYGSGSYSAPQRSQPGGQATPGMGSPYERSGYGSSPYGGAAAGAGSNAAPGMPSSPYGTSARTPEGNPATGRYPGRSTGYTSGGSTDLRARTYGGSPRDAGSPYAGGSQAAPSRQSEYGTPAGGASSSMPEGGATENPYARGSAGSSSSNYGGSSPSTGGSAAGMQYPSTGTPNSQYELAIPDQSNSTPSGGGSDPVTRTADRRGSSTSYGSGGLGRSIPPSVTKRQGSYSPGSTRSSFSPSPYGSSSASSPSTSSLSAPSSSSAGSSSMGSSSGLRMPSSSSGTSAGSASFPGNQPSYEGSSYGSGSW